MGRKKGPLVYQAYEYLKSKILSYELPPGAALSDYAFEQELNMSRSPIREAISMLAANGLVCVTDKGTYVAPISLQDVIEICQVRKAVESAAVNIIMDKGGLTQAQKQSLTSIYQKMQDSAESAQNYYYDNQFHAAIMNACGNQRLIKIFEQMCLQIHRFRWLTYILPNRLQEASNEHQALYNALMADNHEGSLRSLETHLDRSANCFRQVLETPSYGLQFSMAMGPLTHRHKDNLDPSETKSS